MDVVIFISQVFSLSVPILSAGILLIFAIKRNWFAILAKPIDGGRNIFGNNKTWRGVLTYPVVGTLVTALLHFTIGTSPWVLSIYATDPWVLGISMSMAYVAGELTNSFIKRRLGIAPGKATGVIQSFFDNMDGAIACGILLIFAYRVEVAVLATSFFISLLLHSMTDATMQRLGLKSKKQQ